jgi:hypothetical protein
MYLIHSFIRGFSASVIFGRGIIGTYHIVYDIGDARQSVYAKRFEAGHWCWPIYFAGVAIINGSMPMEIISGPVHCKCQ